MASLAVLWIANARYPASWISEQFSFLTGSSGDRSCASSIVVEILERCVWSFDFQEMQGLVEFSAQNSCSFQNMEELSNLQLHQ